VTYLEEEGELTEDDQDYLKSITTELITRAGSQMNVDQEVLQDWITSICGEQINQERTSIYNIAALCMNGLEARQHLLASTTAAEAMHELRQHLDATALNLD
jgi:uncharacterized membrane-anchored protein